PASARDKDLSDKLKAEKSGILNWLVDGVLAWMAGGLVAPAAVRQAIADYRLSGNNLAEWIGECVEFDRDAVALSSELYGSYKGWCDDNGVDRPMTQASFG